MAAYGMSPEKAALGNIEFSGHVLEMVVRLRGSGSSSLDRVCAIALDANISKRALVKEILPTLEALSLVEIIKKDGEIIAINDRIPPFSALPDIAQSIMSAVALDPEERAVLKVFQETTLMPITMQQAVEYGVSVANEEAANHAISYLKALHLCTSQQSDEGAVVLYNPNVWSSDVDYTYAALQAEDGRARTALTALLEEVSTTAGLPQDEVTSVDSKWINFAVAHGLVHRSVVQTSTGEQRAFLFTPHMGRNAFDKPLGVDPSGHVRQLIGSMVFAHKYATNQLWSPTRFLNRLIEDGEAGDASNIGTDYPMLETAGIVRVEPGSRFFKFVLLQGDVAQEALSYLEDSGGSSSQGALLRDQRRYFSPEKERAVHSIQLAKTAATEPSETAKLMAALRQEIGNRRYGKR
ncbi:hypothetical protein EDD27_8955 [Nonomuraea polychroma]|uniref:Uncharacterized protein n=1 Tax=Nonomuraea polychroma TaxID=46176 RepID=A0A438MKG4_9ACTN|nr:hypothetical protein [Nonomuraea polychroma]RVX46105.1 hypothetical protein EDD27_8955 [Nonomuraea polychroma]